MVAAKLLKNLAMAPANSDLFSLIESELLMIASMNLHVTDVILEVIEESYIYAE